jgi:broad specificity phosphatase PhoE
MTWHRPFIIALAGATACAAPPPQSAGSETVQAAPVQIQYPVYVIRHLQKGVGADPSLTPEGAANAQRLATMLGSKGIVAIFATPTRRTFETAAPLAKALGLEVQPYDPSDPAALAAQVAAAGGPVLVVGHSNTVPELVALFGGAEPAPLSEADFGTLFEVAPGGTVTTTEVR